ncbi:MAG: hypothetical protein AAGA77_08555 [Bacteroidota bacterium]
MSDTRLKNIVGTIFILSHCVVVSLILIFRAIGWYEDDILKVSLPIILPIFASFTSLIVDNSVKNQKSTMSNNNSTNLLFRFIIIALPITFFGLLVFILLKYAFARDSIENLALYLGIVESAFAVYISKMIIILFK